MLNLCAGLVLASTAISRADDLPLAAFGEKSFDYPIEKWAPLTTTQTMKDDSVVIHATANGGGGFYFDPARNLASYKVLLVKLRKTANNQTAVIRVVLLSGDSKGSEWAIDLTKLKADEWKTVALLLNSPTKLAFGKTDNVDLLCVQHLQVVGDYANTPLEFEIASVVASTTAPTDTASTNTAPTTPDQK
jgi:hypothetical protein